MFFFKQVEHRSLYRTLSNGWDAALQCPVSSRYLYPKTHLLLLAWKRPWNPLDLSHVDHAVALFSVTGLVGCLVFPYGRWARSVERGAATISAGVSIGQVRIGETLDDVHRALGTPKLSDAAMGGKLLFSHQTRIRGQSRISRASQKI